jgi:hypothetical protein
MISIFVDEYVILPAAFYMWFFNKSSTWLIHSEQRNSQKPSSFDLDISSSSQSRFKKLEINSVKETKAFCFKGSSVHRKPSKVFLS